MGCKQFYEVEFIGTDGTSTPAVMTLTEVVAQAQGRLVRIGQPVPAFEAWMMTPAERGLSLAA